MEKSVWRRYRFVVNMICLGSMLLCPTLGWAVMNQSTSERCAFLDNELVRKNSGPGSSSLPYTLCTLSWHVVKGQYATATWSTGLGKCGLVVNA
jgi:hypothetical protein